MFLMHISLLVGLISLMGALAMFIWGLRTQGPGTEIAKFFGLIIAIVIIIDFICISYYAINYWREGYFSTPAAMMDGSNMMKSKTKMNDSMMDGSMMNQNKQ